MGPTFGIQEVVPAITPGIHYFAKMVRNTAIGSNKPEQSLLVVNVIVPDPFTARIICIRIFMAFTCIIGRNPGQTVIVPVCLSIWHFTDNKAIAFPQLLPGSFI